MSDAPVYLGRNIAYNNYNSDYPFSSWPQRYGYSAFYNQPKLAKVTIGENVTEIPIYAFYECTALSTVSFGNSLTVIPYCAFSDCDITSIDLPSTVTKIANHAFYRNTALTSAKLGSSVTTIGESAFYGAENLKNLEMGNAIESIGQYCFFGSGLESISLPNSVTTVGVGALACSSLKSVTLPNSVTTIGQYALANNTGLTSVTFGNGCKTLPTAILSGCSALTSISIPEGVTTISDQVFANCTALESISIPGSVTQVGTAVYNEVTLLPFYNCTALKSVRFEDGASTLYLGTTFYDLTSSLEGDGLFYGCPLEEVYLGRNIAYDNIGSDYPFSIYPRHYGYSAFYNQPKLAKVTIGAGCTELTDYLFYQNEAITLMDLPNVKKIGNSTFEGCSKLTTLNLGSAIETIGKRAFYNDQNITKLTFPDATTTIGNYAFYNCNSITEVTVGSGMKSIGGYAFYGCKSFTALILPDAFTTMGTAAFEGCTKLTVAKLGTSLTKMPAKAFKDCPSLAEMVVLPKSLNSLGDESFSGCISLPNIEIDGDITYVGKQAFQNCTGLQWVSLSEKITSLGENSFNGCTGVKFVKSYAKIPPEGSVNFPELVLQNGTLFVPEVAVEAYKNSPTWKTWLNIRGFSVIFVEKITLTGEATTLKKGRKLALSATVAPITATNPALVWSSSNDAIASVDDKGVVTALLAGDVVITATAADGSGVFDTYALTIIPPTKGDSNDNDQVTITDAVNTANYAVGNEVEVFNFEAADVNADNKITLSDASGTVAEVLNQPVPSVAANVAKMSRAAIPMDLDNLVIDDYSCEVGNTAKVDVALDNTIDYVAMQADITVPEGMELVAVEAGNRAEAYHSLMSHRIDDRTIRIALFDLANTTFADNDEAILSITIKPEQTNCGDIVITNALASDAEANEYVLTSTGGHNSNFGGISNLVGDGNIHIFSNDGGICIYNAQCKDVYVYAIDGVFISRFTADSNVVNRKMQSGVYIVVVDNVVAKVMVK